MITLDELLLKKQLKKPTVVCLCGSTRFSQAFADQNLYETLAGNIVLSIGCNTKSDEDLIRAGVIVNKDALDTLHLFKIDMADEILVLNVGGYIGESTRREIEYAYRTGKRVRWLQPPTHCNNTSVGMIVERDGKYLLFRRVKKPWGIAPSAGHVDELSYLGHPDEAAIFEHAALRELQEETGLIAERVDLLLETTLHKQCRRLGGDWHKWRVYRVEVSHDAQVRGQEDESQDLAWYTRSELAELAMRTDLYKRGKISETEWQTKPGLEPTWLTIFEELHIL